MRRIFVSHRLAVAIFAITSRNIAVRPILIPPSLNCMMLRIKLVNNMNSPEYKQRNGWCLKYGKGRKNRPPAPQHIKRGCRHK